MTLFCVPYARFTDTKCHNRRPDLPLDHKARAWQVTKLVGVPVLGGFLTPVLRVPHAAVGRASRTNPSGPCS
jgi:hypothetical protein